MISGFPEFAKSIKSEVYKSAIKLILQDGSIHLDFDDEIVAGTVVAHGGEVPHPYMRKLLDLPALDVEAKSK